MEEEYVFNYRLMEFTCGKGHKAVAVQVGTTSDGCLIACWHCLHCKTECTARIDLEELIKNLPDPPQPQKVKITPQDIRLLKEMRISF